MQTNSINAAQVRVKMLSYLIMRGGCVDLSHQEGCELGTTFKGVQSVQKHLEHVLGFITVVQQHCLAGEGVCVGG